MPLDGHFVPQGHTKWGWDATANLPTVGIKCDCEPDCPWLKVFYLSRVVKLDPDITLDEFAEKYKDDPELAPCIWQTAEASAANFENGIEEAIAKLIHSYGMAVRRVTLVQMPMSNEPKGHNGKTYMH